MTPHILILDGNLAGLITAFRLVHYGFKISILKNDKNLTSADEEIYPLVLHSYHLTTWSLLNELALEWPSQAFQPVEFEFVTQDNRTVTLPQLPPIFRLTFFNGLPWSDRINLMIFLERTWENSRPSEPSLDTHTVESWLTSAKQSDTARQSIWTPLCRYFLGCDVEQAPLPLFLEILSQYIVTNTNNQKTFLATRQALRWYQDELRRWLFTKEVKFLDREPISQIQTGSGYLQSIRFRNGEHFTANAYVSPLPPRDLLNILPERALARFAYFSHLAQMPERTGMTIQYGLPTIQSPCRFILSSGLFDWIICQTITEAHSSKTLITCISLNGFPSPENDKGTLNNTAWTELRKIIPSLPEHPPQSPDPQTSKSAFRFHPCQIGSRTFRPLPQTPFSNLFLVGPWTATNLPSSLESTIVSANTCAQAVAKSFY